MNETEELWASSGDKNSPPSSKHSPRSGKHSPHSDKHSPLSDVQRLLNRPWMLVVIVLHLGFLGIPLYWKTRYSRQTRIWIIVLSILYTVAAAIFIIVMIRYIVNALSTL